MSVLQDSDGQLKKTNVFECTSIENYIKLLCLTYTYGKHNKNNDVLRTYMEHQRKNL